MHEKGSSGGLHGPTPFKHGTPFNRSGLICCMVEEGSKSRLRGEALGSTSDKMRTAKFHGPSPVRSLQNFCPLYEMFYGNLDALFWFLFNILHGSSSVLVKPNPCTQESFLSKFEISTSGLRMRIHSSNSPFQLRLGNVEIAQGTIIIGSCLG